MYDDFARHRQASRRRTQVLMLGFALMAIFALVRLGYLQMLHAADYRDQIEDWLKLPAEYPPSLRGSILDRNGTVLAQDAPSWQIEVYYKAIDGGAGIDGGTPYVTHLAVRRIRGTTHSKGSRQAALQAAEESVHQEITSSFQKLAEITGTPVWQVLDNAEQIVERVRTIHQHVARRMGFEAGSREQREFEVGEQQEFHPLLTDVPVELAHRVIAELPETRYPWLRVRASASRWYLDEPSLVPLLGRLRQVSPQDLENDPNSDDELLKLKPGQKIGASGIEYLAEDHLRGRRGMIVRNRAKPDVLIDPVWGKDVRLTIDADLQEWIYGRLMRAVHDCPTASAAAAVVLDVDTREALAVVSYPGYTLEQRSQHYDKLLADRIGMPLLQRAIRGLYQPGSIVKPITVLAGLNSGVVGPGETINCTGYLLPGVNRWRCWTASRPGMGGHGPLDAVGALEHSCNVYCETVGQRLGVPRLTDWMLKCGLGTHTGTGLQEEPNGLVPTVEWLGRNGRRPTVGDARNYSIGEADVLVTPLQAANLCATIATGRWQPVTLLRRQGAAADEARRLPSARHICAWCEKGWTRSSTIPTARPTAMPTAISCESPARPARRRQARVASPSAMT